MKVVMRCWIPVLVLVSFLPVLQARDDQQLALAQKAKVDFDRVVLALLAPLPDTAACAQSQAAILSISPQRISLYYIFEKGIAWRPARR